MGGEITWKNYGSGKFIFETTLYRDCNGIPAPWTYTLLTNVPGLQSGIICQNVSSQDLSPTGLNCPTCATPMGYINSVERHVYRSDTIILTGTPPTTGWIFYRDDCCRSNGLTNLSSTGPIDFCHRAIMYPYNNTNVEDLNDNAPTFLMTPTFATCTRNLTNHNNSVSDEDEDSLSYEWAKPLINSPTGPSYQFATGYSYTSPLPSSTQNQQNISAVLNSSTGNINFKSFTPGLFLVVLKVSSYKCGVLVSEIFREVPIAIFANCIFTNLPPSTYNRNPIFSVDSIPISNGYFADTILAGDSVHYVLTAVDSDAVYGKHQILSTSGFGTQFGDNFSDPTIGCVTPPCATTTPALFITDSISNSFSFNWRTSCEQLSILNNCIQHLRTFQFFFNTKDDFCPVQGFNNQTLAITVRGPEIQNSGSDLFISSLGSTFQWYLDGIAIAGATDSIYTPTVQGIYSVLVTNTNGCSLISNAINITFAGIKNNNQDLFNFNIAPNPIDKNGLSLLISSPSAIQMNVQIVDQLGRSVYNQVVNVNEGNQHIILDPGILATGIYTIQMMNGKNSVEKRFVVN
jgi:hypothetical protein